MKLFEKNWWNGYNTNWEWIKHLICTAIFRGIGKRDGLKRCPWSEVNAGCMIGTAAIGTCRKASAVLLVFYFDSWNMDSVNLTQDGGQQHGNDCFLTDCPLTVWTNGRIHV